jgi:WD40 repeat protein
VKFFIKLLLLIPSIALASCQPAFETSTLAPTVIAPSPSPSAVPTFPPLEWLFNVTPTAAVVSQLLPITAENASNLRPFLGMTQDIIYNVAWSPDGKLILVATSSGLKSYSSFSLKEQPVNLSPFLAQSSVVAFSPMGTGMVWSEANSSGE